MKTEKFEYDGKEYNFSIGKNKEDNIDIFDKASQTDIWFHIQDAPSCFVILTNIDKLSNIPRQVIKKGAYICKTNTKSNSKMTNVMYSPVEYVKKTAIMGRVIVSRYWTITV